MMSRNTNRKYVVSVETFLIGMVLVWLFSMVLCSPVDVYAHIMECTGEIVTPNPDNDVICWEPLDTAEFPALIAYGVYWSADDQDYQQVAEVFIEHNHWSEVPMESGYYKLSSITLEGAGALSGAIYWAPCATWNVDVNVPGLVDWPAVVCIDPGIEIPFPPLDPPEMIEVDTEWTGKGDRK